MENSKKVDIIGKLYKIEPFLATGIMQKLDLKTLGNCRNVSKEWREIYERLPDELQNDVKLEEIDRKVENEKQKKLERKSKQCPFLGK